MGEKLVSGNDDRFVNDLLLSEITTLSPHSADMLKGAISTRLERVNPDEVSKSQWVNSIKVNDRKDN